MLITASNVLRQSCLNRFLSTLEFNPQSEFIIAQWMKSSNGKNELKKTIDMIPDHVKTSNSLDDYLNKYISHLDGSSVLKYPQRHAVNQLLSYPLSLTFGLQQVLSDRTMESNVEETRVTVVGARAEAALPIQWWRHVLFSSPLVNSLSLRFVGPGLNANALNLRFSTAIQWQWEATGKRICLNSDINKDCCVLHEHSTLQSVLNEAHMFVLFNPGIGSFDLREKWRPTMELLLSTKKPILCTALSPYDLDCDIKSLTNFFSSDSIDIIFAPRQNPFSSTLVKQDGDNRSIVSNHSIYIFQGK